MGSEVVVVGAGVFGLCAAVELRRRGAEVTVLDPGPIPQPDAASTDISKLVRLDYGGDEFYTALMERSLLRWRSLSAELGAELFHETGLLVLSGAALAPSSFEGASFDLLRARGHRLERLDERGISERFPSWARGRYVDGYFNPQGGWAESGRVTAALRDLALRLGAKVETGVRVLALGAPAATSGVAAEDGRRFAADQVVMAAGAFTPWLVPDLADRMRVVGQPVFHFGPPDLAAFAPPSFAPWAADIATTGWYGFPAHEGVVKIANHGPGVEVDPRGPRLVGPDKEPRFRAFVREALPALEGAPVVRTRLCLYCDSFDGDFFVDRHPARPGLVVASGGSGHAFKFAPLLGELIADAVEGKPPEPRFAFRSRGEARTEHARFSGS